MSTADNRRLQNHAVTKLYPGARQVLDALEQVNFAINVGNRTPSIVKAHDLLMDAADQMRTAAAAEVDKAAELVLIRYPRTEIRK